MPAPTSVPAAVATAMTRWRNRSSGRTGSAALRSTRTKRRQARGGERQRDQARAPAVRSEEQGGEAEGEQSGSGKVERMRLCSTSSWSATASNAAEAIPAGTLMKKTHRQERIFDDDPAEERPDQACHAPDGPKTPCIRARSSKL